MKITGYALREALRRWQLRRDTVSSQFDGSLYRFQEEPGSKPMPQTITQTFLQAEEAVARLQVAQARYNLQVKVAVEGIGTLSLLECIKRIGGVGRLEKMWRTASHEKKDHYGYGSELTRDKTQEVAQRVISFEAALVEASKYGRLSGSLREAIALGNAKEVELEDFDAALLE